MDPSSDDVRPSSRDLARWSETLAAIARTGLGFTDNLYERERFQEVLNVAADIKAAANEVTETEREQDHFVQEWLESVGVGVPGYVTPKVAIGAIVGNDEGKLLLVQRADSGFWLYPTGWADVGYSPAEVAVKEVAEETGIECVPERVLAIIDGQRMGFSRFGMYMVVFHCRATGGTLEPHPLETSGVGWFGPEELPSATAGAAWWAPMAFAAIGGADTPTAFDAAAIADLEGPMSVPELPEHVLVNRAHWDDDAANWVADGERNWRSEPSWGMWSVPLAGMLPDDMAGMDAIELGCGTGYVSAWMARRGARVVGIDNSARQLDTARRLAEEHGIELTLIHGNAETVPYPDGSFDFAISEYGAAIWCDPYVWIPDAHRLLRPGGTLAFLGTSTLASLCAPLDGSLPITERLEREYFSIYRLDWRQAADEPGGIEFNLPVSAWFRLFRETGFDVVDFYEIQAPEPGAEMRFFVTCDWAHRYPSEQAWVLRKR